MFLPRVLVVWALLRFPGTDPLLRANVTPRTSTALPGSYLPRCQAELATSFSFSHQPPPRGGDQIKERQMKKTALILAAVTALAATAATAPAQARGFGVAAGIAAAVAAGVAADTYYNSGYGYYGGPVYYHAPYYGWHRHYYYRHIYEY
jgi:hypothetical protein